MMNYRRKGISFVLTLFILACLLMPLAALAMSSDVNIEFYEPNKTNDNQLTASPSPTLTATARPTPVAPGSSAPYPSVYVTNPPRNNSVGGNVDMVINDGEDFVELTLEEDNYSEENNLSDSYDPSNDEASDDGGGYIGNETNDLAAQYGGDSGFPSGLPGMAKTDTMTFAPVWLLLALIAAAVYMAIKKRNAQ